MNYFALLIIYLQLTKSQHSLKGKERHKNSIASEKLKVYVIRMQFPGNHFYSNVMNIEHTDCLYTLTFFSFIEVYLTNKIIYIFKVYDLVL